MEVIAALIRSGTETSQAMDAKQAIDVEGE